jgi:putative Holliday junction resolvase
MTGSHGTIMALDVGAARIGVATASTFARLSSPHGAIANNDQVWETLRKLCKELDVVQLVVGRPRGLSGQETEQTAYSENFAHELALQTELPVSLIDEAVTSRQAEAELRARGKRYEKGDIDALAAVYILDDFLQEQANER